jgi:long-chain acyl-CoA synthetase
MSCPPPCRRIAVACHQRTLTLSEVQRLASAGCPAPGVEVRVVDERDCDVKPGAVGEIVVRGSHVMAGYWKLPEVTAEALHVGWLHTQGMATVDAAGFIYIVDRKDDLAR